MPRRGPAPHPRPGNWPGPHGGVPQYPDPITEPIPVLRPPQGPRSRRKFQLAIFGAVAALALVGGTAAAAAGMGLGNIGTPASACDIPLSVMNEAFDSTSFGVADLSEGATGRLAPGIRCVYGQGVSSSANDGLVEVSVLRQEPPESLYLAMLEMAKQQSGGARGNQSAIPIVTISGGGESAMGELNGSGFMLCMTGNALWMATVQDDPSGISFEGLDTVANAIGCEPQP